MTAPDPPGGRYLTVWVIYDHPADYPECFVLRPQYAIPGDTVIISEQVWTSSTLDGLRQHMPPGLARVGPSPDDDPAILEVWI